MNPESYTKLSGFMSLRCWAFITGNLHDVKGYGLGLYYVHSIVEKHGWNISVEPDPRIRIVNVRGEGYKLLVNE